jgi:DNA polymerase III delta subunit
LSGGPKLVVVRPADDFVKKKKEVVLSYLDQPTEFGRLVLVARSFGSGKNRVRDRLKKAGAYREFKRPAAAVKPWEEGRRRPGDTDLSRWVNDRARSRNLRLESGVAAALSGAIGANLGELDSILERWEMMYGCRVPIGLDAVEALGPRHQEVSSFGLVDAVMKRDVRLAIQMLDSVFTQGLAMGDRRITNPGEMLPLLLAALLGRLRQAARAQCLGAAGLGREALAQELGVRSFLIGRTLDEARRFEEAELHYGIRRLLEADRELKFRRQDGRKVLVDLVLDLIRGRRAPYPVRI